jgi:hypothetical protein
MATQEPEKKGPKTLLEWTLGKSDERERENGNKGKDKGGSEKGKDSENGKDSANNQGAKNGDGIGENTEKEKESEPKRIDTDRPHLPEASTTVGLGPHYTRLAFISWTNMAIARSIVLL